MGDRTLIVLDTHALVWWVSGVRALSVRAQRAVRTALRAGPLHASTMSVLEIATAVRCGRLVLASPIEQWLRDLELLPELRLEPLTAEIARIAGTFGDPLHGDPADRVILATAQVLGARLVTADARLRRAPQAQAVW